MALVCILYSRTANVRTSREMLMVESKRVSHRTTMWGVSLYSASLPTSASDRRSKHPFGEMLSTCKCHIHIQDEAAMSLRLSPSHRIVPEVDRERNDLRGNRSN